MKHEDYVAVVVGIAGMICAGFAVGSGSSEFLVIGGCMMGWSGAFIFAGRHGGRG